MRPRHESSRTPSKIIDVDVTSPTAPADAVDLAPPPPQTFRERHALKVMGVVMAAMFATVIIAQVGC